MCTQASRAQARFRRISEIREINAFWYTRRNETWLRANTPEDTLLERGIVTCLDYALATSIPEVMRSHCAY